MLNVTPLFSVLIVLFNSSLNFIEKNIKNNELSIIEYIIIDNSENEEYHNFLLKWLNTHFTINEKKKIKIFRADFNGGYTRGNNLAYLKSTGNFLLILNPDIELSKNFLLIAQKIINIYDWDIMSPKEYNSFHEKKIQSGLIKQDFSNPFDFVKIVGYNKSYDGLKYGFYDTFYAQGGCFLIKSNIFKTLRGFDENFFMYSEELDLCTRAKKRGFRIIYCPMLEAVHHHDSKRVSPFSETLRIRNDIAYFGKNHNFFLLFYQFLFSFPRSIIRLIIKEEKFRCDIKAIKPYFKAILDGFVLGFHYNLNKTIF